MKNRGSVLVGIISCAGFLGCTLQTGSSADQTEESNVASTTQGLIGGWAKGTWTWSQGQPPQVMESASDHVCVLTALGGHFAGAGEWVRVSLTPDGNNWELNGNSSQSGVFGEAVCFPLNQFFGGIKPFYSNETVAYAWSRGSATSQAKGGGCQQAQVNVGLGTDFGFIEGMQGEMAGGGEFSQAIPSPSVNTINILRSQICTKGEHYTYGRWLRANPYQSFLAKFIDGKVDANGNPVPGDLNATKEFRVTFERGSSNRVWATTNPLVPTNAAMCAFTTISGKFFGEGEFARIAPSPDGSKWQLSVSMGAGSNYISAGVRCFSRFQ